jgi:glycosyltransferase involved in cell wall biosynthesis
MKKVLVISPNFPPVNAADMHRIRQSLLYFNEFGWEATVIAVEPQYIEMNEDPLLLETLPKEAKIIRIKAFEAKTTRKFGLGNSGYRSMWQYYTAGNKLLRNNQFDLVYFSTTAFPVMVLGRIWKKKFKVPYIIDMQDPWRNDFYLDKPKSERPPKFWMAYHMDKYLEAFTMKKVDGIVSVSAGYPKMLMERYSNIKPDDCTVIPFGGASIDFEVLDKVSIPNKIFKLDNEKIHIVYIGRGGHDMQLALGAIFAGLAQGVKENPSLFERLMLYFIGTSYAADGQGSKTVEPVAKRYGVDSQVVEITDRLPYFEAMRVLKDADLLIIPGSTDTNYTASKLYPYILAKRPLIAVFNESSSVVEILKETNTGRFVSFINEDDPLLLGERFLTTLKEELAKLPYVPDTNWDAFEPYSAREATRKQVLFFEKILNK